MRLLVIMHAAGSGGAGRSLVELVTELTRDHAAHCTVVLPADGAFRAKLEAAGAATAVVPFGWWCQWERRPAHRSAANVLAWMHDTGIASAIDVIVTFSMTIPWGAIAAAAFGKPHVWCVRETGRTLKWLLPLDEMVRLIDESSNAIAAVSIASAAPFAGIDRPITIARVHVPAADVVPRRAGPVATRQRHRLVALGLLAPDKGQQDAIDALVLLAAAGHPCDLVLVGPSEAGERDRLRAHAAAAGLDRVEIRDPIDHPADALAEADVALVCSRDGALDRVLIEAMLARVPIVAARSGGAIEVCQEGAHGLLYAPGDPADLAANVARMLTQIDAREARVARAYAFALRTFTAEGYGGVLARLFRSSAGATNPTPRGWAIRLLARLADAERGVAATEPAAGSRALAEPPEADVQIALRQRELDARARVIEGLVARVGLLETHIDAVERSRSLIWGRRIGRVRAAIRAGLRPRQP